MTSHSKNSFFGKAVRGAAIAGALVTGAATLPACGVIKQDEPPGNDPALAADPSASIRTAFELIPANGEITTIQQSLNVPRRPFFPDEASKTREIIEITNGATGADENAVYLGLKREGVAGEWTATADVHTNGRTTNLITQTVNPDDQVTWTYNAIAGQTPSVEISGNPAAPTFDIFKNFNFAVRDETRPNTYLLPHVEWTVGTRNCYGDMPAGDPATNGSVTNITARFYDGDYHDALVAPGSAPASANLRPKACNLQISTQQDNGKDVSVITTAGGAPAKALTL